MAAWVASPSAYDTASGNKTLTTTPTAGELIILVTAHTGNTSLTAPTDNNSSGTYTLVNSAARNSSAHTLAIWVRDALIASTTSTIFTHACGTSTGGGMTVIRISGISNAGAAAIRQSAKQDNQGTGTPAPVFSLTPVSTNMVIGAIFVNAAPTQQTERTGYTERYDNGYASPAATVGVMTLDSGETSATITWGGPTSAAFCSIAVELAGVVVNTLTCAGGTFTLSGQAASIKHSAKVVAAAGTFALSGQAASVKVVARIAAGFGSFSLAGQAVTLRYLPTPLGVGMGDFLLGGQAAMIRAGRPFVAGQGAFTLTGQAASIKAGRAVAAGQGSFTLAGQDASFHSADKVTAAMGAFSLAGQAASIRYADDFGADHGAFALSGQDAGFTFTAGGEDYTLTADAGTFSLAGQAATFRSGYAIPAAAGSFVLTGQGVTFIAPEYVEGPHGGSYVPRSSDWQRPQVSATTRPIFTSSRPSTAGTSRPSSGNTRRH